MYRTLPYLALFAATVLLQVFLFDNLSISVYLNPLVYIAFIVLLPLDTPPVVLLGAGLALGVTMDGAMGGRDQHHRHAARRLPASGAALPVLRPRESARGGSPVARTPF